MQEKLDFMTCSDVIPAKWYIIQHCTKFGKVLYCFCHFTIDLESKTKFCEKNKIISKIFILHRKCIL